MLDKITYSIMKKNIYAGFPTADVYGECHVDS